MRERITVIVDIDREDERVYQPGFNPLVMVLKGLGFMLGLAFYAAWLVLDTVCRLLMASLRFTWRLMHGASRKRQRKAQPMRVIAVTERPVALITEKPEEIGVWRVVEKEKVHV